MKLRDNSQITNPALRQIDELKGMQQRLKDNPELSDKLNAAIFGIANTLGVHPHDLAIYILIRTTSL